MEYPIIRNNERRKQMIEDIKLLCKDFILEDYIKAVTLQNKLTREQRIKNDLEDGLDYSKCSIFCPYMATDQFEAVLNSIIDSNDEDRWKYISLYAVQEYVKSKEGIK